MTRFPGQRIQKDIREEGSCPGQWIHVVDHPGRTKQAPGEGVTCSSYSGQRQNPVRSEALSWLLPSLFPTFLSPPQCSLSLGQWQEEPAGPEMALLLWCERGFGGADGY